MKKQSRTASRQDSQLQSVLWYRNAMSALPGCRDICIRFLRVFVAPVCAVDLVAKNAQVQDKGEILKDMLASARSQAGDFRMEGEPEQAMKELGNRILAALDEKAKEYKPQEEKSLDNFYDNINRTGRYDTPPQIIRRLLQSTDKDIEQMQEIVRQLIGYYETVLTALYRDEETCGRIRLCYKEQFRSTDGKAPAIVIPGGCARRHEYAAKATLVSLLQGAYSGSIEAFNGRLRRLFPQEDPLLCRRAGDVSGRESELYEYIGIVESYPPNSAARFYILSTCWQEQNRKNFYIGWELAGLLEHGAQLWDCEGKNCWKLPPDPVQAAEILRRLHEQEPDNAAVKFALSRYHNEIAASASYLPARLREAQHAAGPEAAQQLHKIGLLLPLEALLLEYRALQNAGQPDDRALNECLNRIQQAVESDRSPLCGCADAYDILAERVLAEQRMLLPQWIERGARLGSAVCLRACFQKGMEQLPQIVEDFLSTSPDTAKLEQLVDCYRMAEKEAPQSFFQEHQQPLFLLKSILFRRIQEISAQWFRAQSISSDLEYDELTAKTERERRLKKEVSRLCAANGEPMDSVLSEE